MFDWLPTEGMAIGAYVLTLLTIGLIVMAYRIHLALKQTAAWRDTIPTQAAKQPYKPLHIEV